MCDTRDDIGYIEMFDTRASIKHLYVPDVVSGEMTSLLIPDTTCITHDAGDTCIKRLE